MEEVMPMCKALQKGWILNNMLFSTIDEEYIAVSRDSCNKVVCLFLRIKPKEG